MLFIKFKGKHPEIKALIFLFCNVLIIFSAMIILIENGYLIDQLFLILPFIFLSELFLTTLETLIEDRKKKQE